jgi:hypothetical protein
MVYQQEFIYFSGLLLFSESDLYELDSC